MKTEGIEIAAGILAGGKNSRMRGRNKSFINIEGVPIIEKTILLFEGIFDEIILITNSPNDYKEYVRRVIIAEDEIKEAGPLGGMHAGLSKTSKGAVFFVACDMPFLHNALINRLAKHFNGIDRDAVVPRINSLIEPMHAIYRSSLKDKLARFLRMGGDYSIRSFLRGENVEYFNLKDTPLNRKIFRNLNTPDDFKKTAGARWK